MSPPVTCSGVEAEPCNVCGGQRTGLLVTSHMATHTTERPSAARRRRMTTVTYESQMPTLDVVICCQCDGITWKKEAHDV